MTTGDLLASLPRRVRRDRVWRSWVEAWVGGAALGMVNGTLRDLLYKDRVGDLAAQQLSTASLLALLALYCWLLERRWPIPTTRTALSIGGMWLVLTVLFEFGLGRYVTHESWSDLLGNYNLAEGRLWVLVPLWMGLAPAVTRRLHAARS
ncbi:MAG TPA: hypothetical protein VFA46_06165 [Actinomycetes bacterium]|nr:hypothetical protein [Actinomycetes bacterium]